MDSIKLLQDFSNAPGAPGFEDAVLDVARGYAPAGSSCTEDSVRNLYIRHPALLGGHKPVVMLDAHADEVAFMVQAIQPNGLLRIVPLGGWMDYTIPAHKVLVRTATGRYVPGIVATKPPHFMTDAEKTKPMTIDKMTVDVGALSAQEVREVHDIRIGAPVVPDVQCSYDPRTGLLLGKAFDCRAGCACVLEVLNTVVGQSLAVDVVGTLAAQEEVGVRGARVTAQTVKPDIAIVFEGCPADDNFAEPFMVQTGLKRGPMLRHIDRSMITNPRYMRFALDIAEELGIPVQESVRSGGSTNGASIHLSGDGVPCIVVGIPVRYVHTHHGFTSLTDYQHCVRLGVEVLRRLNAQVIAGF